jgi:hypothetical protein
MPAPGEVVLNVWPLVVATIVRVHWFAFLVKVAVYVPGGTVKVTMPCEFVVPLCPDGERDTVAPGTGFPLLSTALMETVTVEGAIVVVF